MHSLPFEEQVAMLRRRLAMPLPGPTAHLEMAPHDRRQTPDLLDVGNKPCRKAAVMAILFPSEAQIAVLLTKRNASLSQHAGQISFPGGRNEPNESLIETALRETQEEIGLAPHGIDILGSLSPLYISVSNYCVYPFVGAIPEIPVDLTPQEEEVTQILKLPLANFSSPEARRVERWNIRGIDRDIPHYGVAGETIWGATAMMLSELLTLFNHPEEKSRL